MTASGKMKHIVKKFASRKVWVLPLLLLFAILARHPYLFLYPFPGAPMAGRFFIVDFSVVSCLAIFIILASKWTDLFYYTRITTIKLFRLSLLSVFSICVLQFLLMRNYTFREFSFNLVWFALPLAIFLRANEFKRIVVPFFVLFWVFNAIYAGQDLWRMGEEIGIPANRNWHASFIIATTPFTLLFAYRFLSTNNFNKKLTAAILSIPMGFSLIVLYRCQSRGANLALLATLLLALVLYLFNNHFISAKTLKKCCVWGPITMFLVIVLLLLFEGDVIASLIMRDVRVPLWGGAINLFLHNPWMGVGSASYESQYVYHIPVAKFLRSWYYTERSDNPHSHFLYMLGSLGIVGFTAALYLWVQPTIHCLKRFNHLDSQTKLTLFVFIALTLHSMVDITISKWPTIYLALILQGLLWRESFFARDAVFAKSSSTGQSHVFSALSKTLAVFTGIAILALLANMIYNNTRASKAARNAMLAYENGYIATALRDYDKAMRADCLPIYTYQTGMISLLYARDYRLALKYFEHLQAQPGKIIVHSNAHIAECLIELNRKKEALSYLKKELRVYPVSLIALYNKLQLEKDLGLIDDADATAKRLFATLKFKGLNINDLKIVLRQPEFDGRYDRLKEKPHTF